MRFEETVLILSHFQEAERKPWQPVRSYEKHNTLTMVDPASSPSSIEERKLLPTGRRPMASFKALVEEES